MKAFDKYVRRIFFGTLLVVLVLAGAFLFAGNKTWARGLVLGGAASLVNLVLMASDVRRQGLVMEGGASRPAYGPYALRMVVIAAALIYAAANENIALWATIPALFASQFAMTCGELLGGKEQETT